MDEKSTESLARDLSTLFRLGAAAGLTDGQLLDRFAAGGEGGLRGDRAEARANGPGRLPACPGRHSRG